MLLLLRIRGLVQTVQEHVVLLFQDGGNQLGTHRTKKNEWLGTLHSSAEEDCACTMFHSRLTSSRSKNSWRAFTDGPISKETKYFRIHLVYWETATILQIHRFFHRRCSEAH